MCGIAGFVAREAPADGGPHVRRMTEALRHRGPDDSGFYHDPWCSLGHRRLSIIDLAGGRQPLSNENGSIWITYNGEIYNHRDLRAELERRGHRYATHCDTEAIVHAFEEYGPACVDHFRGMFAFALWNKDTRELFCARDRFGIKPFYYYADGRLFAFASEIKALLEHPDISAALDESSLPEFLAFGFTSGERTLFRNIRKLMPGHWLRLRVNGGDLSPEIERYWDAPAAADSTRRDEKEWIAETARHLDDAVQSRLMSDVPLGMFLSGGIDSNAIAAIACPLVATPLKTFSVGYPETSFSELSAAAESARVIGTEHREITVDRDSFFGALPQVVWQEDEPPAWPSSVSLYFVSKLASQHVKVVLTGEGSDEIFGGYERYRWNLLNQRGLHAYERVPEPLRRGIRNRISASRLLSASMRRRLGHSFAGRDSSMESLYLDNFYCAFNADEVHSLVHRDAPVYAGFLAAWNARPDSSLLAHMLHADQKTYLVELLMKQDRMSMAWSLESRVPFLDHHLAEFAASIPDDLRIHGAVQKVILRKAMASRLPKILIARRKKGFPTPVARWFREDASQPLLTALLEPGGLLAACCDPKEIEGVLARHRAGASDETDRLWRLLTFQIWGDLFLTGRRDRWPGRESRSEAALSPL